MLLLLLLLALHIAEKAPGLACTTRAATRWPSGGCWRRGGGRVRVGRRPAVAVPPAIVGERAVSAGVVGVPARSIIPVIRTVAPRQALSLETGHKIGRARLVAKAYAGDLVLASQLFW